MREWALGLLRNNDPRNVKVQSKEDLDPATGVAATGRNYYSLFIASTRSGLPQDCIEPTLSKGGYHKQLNRFSSKSSLYSSSREVIDEDGDVVSVNNDDAVLDLVEERDNDDCDELVNYK